MDKRHIIKEAIENNKDNYQFTVGCLADQVGVSYSYLYEMVYQCFDMSPQQLIETVRLEEAIRLIATGKKQIKIYKNLGYGNIRSFREAFTRRMRMNFSDCRSQLDQETGESLELEINKHINSLWVNN